MRTIRLPYYLLYTQDYHYLQVNLERCKAHDTPRIEDTSEQHHLAGGLLQLEFSFHRVRDLCR